ncbi:hypothetical protein [Paraburkholderia kirstenboschensis]|uniref:Uncharacterized protein n=1 Tax=Paraburkholderia kirstenboschensis TaxID=1245436 RepID=A0ABZ0EID8_9BURK|nr:hypothetical protein [Paraburkholderia kirstenboschensis]WOD16984.1 hypothetical protein RW095_14130 [Paraburkholderia kirstenboschensis]
MALPVLRKLNNGVPSSLVFTRPGNIRDEPDVVRFWSSGYAVENSASATPIWVGSFANERLFRPSWPINILRADNEEVTRLNAHDNWGAGLGATVLARVDCHGVAVALLASPEE